MVGFFKAFLDASRGRSHQADFQVTVRVHVRNKTVSPMRLRIEPWAEEFDHQPEIIREFVFTGPNPADVDVEADASALTIGWALISMATAFRYRPPRGCRATVISAHAD